MWQPRPPERSSIVLPSTSVNDAPLAASMIAGTCRSSGSDTTRSLRAISSREFGPGISVTTLTVPIAGRLPAGTSRGSAGSPAGGPRALVRGLGGLLCPVLAHRSHLGRQCRRHVRGGAQRLLLQQE